MIIFIIIMSENVESLFRKLLSLQSTVSLLSQKTKETLKYKNINLAQKMV